MSCDESPDESLLIRSYHLQIFQSNKSDIIENFTSTTPEFDINNLQPNTYYNISAFTTNEKGASKHLYFQLLTERPPKVQKSLKSKFKNNPIPQSQLITENLSRVINSSYEFLLNCVTDYLH